MKISIVITAYNVEQWVRQAVVSALQQTPLPPKGGDNPEWYKWDLEVIVVNDASTDGTASILEELRIKREELRILTNAVNYGAGMSRKIGIAAATGDYILLLDGDDYLMPTFIASLAYSAQKYDADIVSGGITILRDEKIGYFDQTCYGNFIAESANKVTNFYSERIVFMNNKLIRRRLHEQVPYCERRYIEDTPVIAKMLYYANKVVYTNNPGYVYRMQPDSLTHKSSQLKSGVYRALCVIELIDFYRGKGEPYETLFGIRQFYKIYDELKHMKLTDEINNYKPEVEAINRYAAQHLEEYKKAKTGDK